MRRPVIGAVAPASRSTNTGSEAKSTGPDQGASKPKKWPFHRHKFNATRTVVEGVSFASKREAKRYGQLKALEKAGKIRDLELQPKFVFQSRQLIATDLSMPEHDTRSVLIRSDRYPNGRVASYKADFRYIDVATGESIVEDAGSHATHKEAQKLRVALVEYFYGVKVREV